MKFIYSDEAKCCAKSIMANASAIRFHFSVKHEALSRNELNAHLKLLRLEAESRHFDCFGENNYFLSFVNKLRNFFSAIEKEQNSSTYTGAVDAAYDILKSIMHHLKFTTNFAMD